MSDLYICIDCELANAQAEPTSLNEHGYCSRCGSSSVVPVDTLRELDAKRKREANAPLEPTSNTQAWVQAAKDQRKRDSRPLVEYLKSLIQPDSKSTVSIQNAAIIAKALEEWDGWSWHVVYPWDEESVAPGHFTIELVQGVKNGERWLITLDAALAEVSLFQNGMN